MKNTLSPQEALQRLKDGNQRYVNGTKSLDALSSHKKMPELAEKGQKPFAIILSCSDSRSPSELIFDQGVGDLFVVRVAGNVAAPSQIASMEFAAANFGSSLLVIKGHTLCGAVGATVQHYRAPGTKLPSAHLEELIGRIRPSVDDVVGSNKNVSENDLVALATVENVRHSARVIKEQSPILNQLIASGGLKIVTAVLDIATGRVNWLE